MDGWGIDLAISNGGAEMHQWDTPTVRIGSLPFSISMAWKKVKNCEERILKQWLIQTNGLCGSSSLVNCISPCMPVMERRPLGFLASFDS